MNRLSPAALDLLNNMLSLEIEHQVELGFGHKPMPSAWTELHRIVLAERVSDDR